MVIPGTYLPDSMVFSVRRGYCFLHNPILSGGSGYAQSGVRFSLQNPAGSFSLTQTMVNGTISLNTFQIPIPTQFTRFVNSNVYRHWCTYASEVKRTVWAGNTSNEYMFGINVSPLNRAISDSALEIYKLNYAETWEHYMDDPKAMIDVLGTDAGSGAIKVYNSKYRIANLYGIPERDVYLRSYGRATSLGNYDYANTSIGFNEENCLEAYTESTVFLTNATPNTTAAGGIYPLESAASVHEMIEIVYHMVAWNDNLNYQELTENAEPEDEDEQPMSGDEQESSFTLSQLRPRS